MKLDDAIAQRKTGHYRSEKTAWLFTFSHPSSWSFQSHLLRKLGYSQENWLRLEQDLRSQHLTSDAEEIGTTSHGRKYQIQAAFEGPNGKCVQLISIWIIRTGEDRPRFVTAYPGGS